MAKPCISHSCEEDYLRLLIPLFPHDVLLPRTLTAILGYRKLLQCHNAAMIPAEAYMANLFYQIKANKLWPEEEEVWFKTLWIGILGVNVG